MPVQGKGSATRVALDWETAYNVPKTSSKTGKIIEFNNCDVHFERTLNNATAIRGDRNPTVPFVGNKNVAGTLTVPMRADSLGFFLKAAIGQPTSVEGSSAANIMAGTPTITIGSLGAYTFSAAQTAVVGDRVVFLIGGVQNVGYITTKTNSTTGVLSADRAAGTQWPSQVGAKTVVGIYQNLADATPGTVNISGGVATFTSTHASLANGQMFIYDAAGAPPKVGIILSKLTATTANVTDTSGVVLANAAGKTVEWLGIRSYWVHTFKIDPTDDPPSFILEKAFLDLDTPYYEVFSGCRINTMGISIGGDGELLATLGILGATNSTGIYDSAAVEMGGTKFQQFQASAEEGGSPILILRTLQLNFSNDLDPDSFVIGGQGTRVQLPAGIAQVNGSIEALFEDTSLLVGADGETESSLSVAFDPATSDALTISMPEVIYAPNSPAIPGPKGILLNLNFNSFYDDGANASAIVCTLTNLTASY